MVTEDLPKDLAKFVNLLQETKAELSIRINGYLIEGWEVEGIHELEITIDGKPVNCSWREACSVAMNSKPKPFGDE